MCQFYIRKHELPWLVIPSITRVVYLGLLILLVASFSNQDRWGISPWVVSVLVLLAIVIEYAILFKIIKKKEESLPNRYLQRAGQLQFFGYGILAGQE